MPARSAHAVDVRTLVAVVEDGRQDIRGEVLPVATLEGLFTLIGADDLAVVDVDPVTGHATGSQWMHGGADHGYWGPEECQDQVFARYFSQWALPAYQRTSGDFVTPLRWSDFLHDLSDAQPPAVGGWFPARGQAPRADRGAARPLPRRATDRHVAG